MSRYIPLFVAFTFLTQEALTQRIIAEFSSKNRQLNFQAIPFGDSILFSYDEVVGPNGRRVRDIKWVSKAGVAHDIFCPVNVFAVESEGDKIYHYYREKKSLRAYELLVGSRTMNNLDQSIEFNDVMILASYVNENLFLVLLKEGGNEISIQEIAGMEVVKTTSFKLPIALNEFIKKNTYIEFYNTPMLDSFKGRARVKIFLVEADIYLVIDDKKAEATEKSPNVTHVLHLNKTGQVKHHRFPSAGKADFGSFLHDGKLFQNHISKEKFSLLVYDLSGKQLSRHEIMADSIDVERQPKVNLRRGYDNFQGWDSFRDIFKQNFMSDPLIVVSGKGQGYHVQWGTYVDEKGPGPAASVTPLATMLTVFVTTAIRQVTEGTGASRYVYLEADVNSGKVGSPEVMASGSVRGKIDEYERSRQKKSNSPFESKSYIPFLDGVVAIYRTKPLAGIGVTQLVYFE